MKIFKRKYNTESNTKYFDSWVRFYSKFNSSLYISKAGYFDERPELHTSITQLISLIAVPILSFYSIFFLLLTPFIFFGWGKLYIHLPIKTGIEDSDSAAWGFNYHNDSIWIYIGGGGNFDGGKKWITFEMPWTLIWYRTSILLNDNSWEHELKGFRKDFYDDKWDSKKMIYICKYTDIYDGKIVNSEVKIVEREWRRRIIMFLPVFRKVNRYLDVKFEKEVGDKKGTYKGGILGTSFKIEKGEEIAEALKRNGFYCKSLNRDELIDKILK